MAIATEQILARLTDLLIAVSDRVRDDLVEFRIASPDKIIAIPLGIDLEPFTRVRPKSDGEPIVGIVGRLVPIKNHALFLNMARRLIHDGFPGRFLVVGDGELRGELENSAADLGDRIMFAGWRRDLPQIYSQLSVVVNTSLNEGTPVALIEAMAAGVPVVATIAGGVPDVVRPGQTGWLVPSGDADALVESVKAALRSDRQITAQAQADVLARFSKERLITDVERLYDSLIEQSQARDSKLPN